MSTATTSSASSLSGIFAKFVAKFLVNWVKKTLGTSQASPQPALSSTPSEVSGRPQRDRGHEAFGEHTGSSGARADESPAAAQAIVGDDYGAHRGCHVAPMPERTHTAMDAEMRRAAIWSANTHAEGREALRSAPESTLREYGMTDRQVDQCHRGRVPQGHLLDRVASNSNGGAWVLSPLSPESQVQVNSLHQQVIDIRIGDVRILSLPQGESSMVLVLGPSSQAA